MTLIFRGICNCCESRDVSKKVREYLLLGIENMILCKRGWDKEREKRKKMEGIDIGSFTGIKRGFAVLGEEERRAIAKRGGIKAQSNGYAHKFTKEEAREAGKKGGKTVVEKRGRNYFRELGKKGGTTTACKKWGYDEQDYR